MVRLYTRGGDQGMTGVIGGRVPKDSVRVEAYGTVDEVNSFLGLAIAQLDDEKFADLKKDLLTIQHELFDCGADLSLVMKEEKKEDDGTPAAPKYTYRVTAEMVQRLESWIDRYHAEAPEIRRFILPGGSPASAYLHVCRVLTRRAERRVVTLAKEEPINLEVRRYLNRLSDFFFAVARCANAREGVPDVEYARSGEVFR
ncbi:MAG: ATP:cob(I)alamin adenosyltransferase [Bacillus thermozeamaize]|uniref:Corrinoid adenosyltransferase n=1 Tax=Bacillus thermozeamaize TaxID=230954 RepID=A0A1Y3PEP1_9BACI|nr:MAG: ATP:cob(I)alamin adenosyltransferase [Bacillus thermozeamaize]